MSESSLYWTDPARLAQLAQRAGGGAANPVREAVRRPAPPEPRVATPPVTVASAAIATIAGPSAPTRDTLEGRFAALLEWLEGQFGCRTSFVADPQGLALQSRHAEDGLVACATNLALQWERLRRPLAPSGLCHVTMELEPGVALHVLTVALPWGLTSLGFATDQTLSFAALQRILEALTDTVEP